MIGPDAQLSEAQVREIVLRELRGSDLAVLVRQLQGQGARVVWNGQVGPLTLSSAQVMRGGSVLALWAGSGFRSVANGTGQVTVELFLDGASLGVSERFTNETVSHKSTVPGAAVRSVAAGSRTWELRASATTTTDSSDRFMLLLVEF